jgi:alkyl hydroperoxide reductase subunit AhpC
MAYWNDKFQKISIEDFKDKWIVLFFYPLDNTFVCPTEIVAFNDASDKFEAINTQLIACSIDSHFSHKEWANKPRHQGGLAPMKIPMLADIAQNISTRYGVRINDENDESQGLSLRGTFIIDPQGILRHSSVNDLPVGRNVDEVLRTVKAFQFVAKHGEVCPASWQEGKKAIPVGNPNGVADFWKNEHAKKH